MKDKMKKIVEKCKTRAIVISAGTMALTCGVIGFKLGRKDFEAFRKSINNDQFFETLWSSINASNSYYTRTLGPDEIMKFKDIGILAKDAIDFSDSSSHMEDNIIGMFVMTNHKT